MKRLNAPKHWMVEKLGGAFVSIFDYSKYDVQILKNDGIRMCYICSVLMIISIEQAPKPSSGPHKARESLPLILMLRNRLKYALTYREVVSIMMQRHIMVDGKVRTDKTYPAGFMGNFSCLCFDPDFPFLLMRCCRLLLIYSVLQMLCQFRRQGRTSAFFTTPRVASVSTASRMRRLR